MSQGEVPSPTWQTSLTARARPPITIILSLARQWGWPVCIRPLRLGTLPLEESCGFVRTAGHGCPGATEGVRWMPWGVATPEEDGAATHGPASVFITKSLPWRWAPHSVHWEHSSATPCLLLSGPCSPALPSAIVKGLVAVLGILSGTIPCLALPFMVLNP